VYPPQPGGVADYTRLVARGLAAAGDEVHVWCPAWPGLTPGDDGVTVHRLPDHFGPRGLAALDRGLSRLPRDARLLVQYVPHAFGYKGMNLPLCLWLASWRRQRLWVMFHEVAVGLRLGQPLRHNALGAATHVMAWLLRRAAARTFVSTPSWAGQLRRLAPGPVEWLPVPCPLPEGAESGQAAARGRLAPDAGSVLLGHFGTYGPYVAPLLARVLPPLLLADCRRRAVLVGRHSAEFTRALASEHGGIAGRLAATGEAHPAEVAACLAACDVLVQPYPDGATTRRTTLMSGLALGRPVVTTTGCLTEPLWTESGAVALAPADEPVRFIEQVERLLGSDARRADLGANGRSLYRARFSTERLVDALRMPVGSGQWAVDSQGSFLSARCPLPTAH
jgi:glycosyltransferase involved in cell wall biosynthesis